MKKIEKKLLKIRKQLGGSDNIFEPLPSKPMLMHYQKYARLKFEYRDLMFKVEK